jgi:NAD(P)-dependent dehydrogenase (short-subunit alcohol dehydrogenase family)
MSTPQNLLVVGGGGGIGQALLVAATRRWPGCARTATHRPGHPPPQGPHEAHRWLPLDLTSETSITEFSAALLDQEEQLDGVVVASGWLHDADHQPEKSLRSLSMEAFDRAWRINASGPLTLLSKLSPLLRAGAGEARPRIMMLSAKVGSISDNSLGGWHSYRMAKAGLNMGVRNLGIEFARSQRAPIIAAVHPGTTESPLSAPFAKRGLPVVEAAVTGERLLDFFDAMIPSHQGGFYHWDGTSLAP